MLLSSTRLIVIIITIIIISFGTQYLMLNHKIAKQKDIIQSQELNISNLKVEKQQLINQNKIDKFEQNQSFQKQKLLNSFELDDKSMSKDTNASIIIKNTRDIVKLKDLEPNNTFILEIK